MFVLPRGVEGTELYSMIAGAREADQLLGTTDWLASDHKEVKEGIEAARSQE
jgi:hypothetical protein